MRVFAPRARRVPRGRHSGRDRKACWGRFSNGSSASRSNRSQWICPEARYLLGDCHAFAPLPRHVSHVGFGGQDGNRKTHTLHIIANFAHRPVRLSLRGMTTPTVRDKFAEAYNGTAVIEEAARISRASGSGLILGWFSRRPIRVRLARIEWGARHVRGVDLQVLIGKLALVRSLAVASSIVAGLWRVLFVRHCFTPPPRNVVSR
jgi:hypothetical protein